MSIIVFLTCKANFWIFTEIAYSRLGGLPSAGKVENKHYYVRNRSRFYEVPPATFISFYRYENISSVVERLSWVLLFVGTSISFLLGRGWHTVGKLQKATGVQTRHLDSYLRRSSLCGVVSVIAGFSMPIFLFLATLEWFAHSFVAADVLILIAVSSVAISYIFQKLSRMFHVQYEAIRSDSAICSACGYSLLGNESGRCPECGGNSVAKR